MSKKLSQIPRRQRGRILARYLFPLFSLVVTAIFSFVPCLRYISAEEGTLPNQSLWEMLTERFEVSRVNLFGSNRESLSPVGIRFSKTELIALIAFWLLFLAALVLTVYVTYQVFSILENPDRRDKGRVFFLTLVPNRTAYCLYQLAFFPLLFYPRVWLWLLRSIMSGNITLHLSFAEPWMIALPLFFAQILLSILSAKVEAAYGIDPFRKKFVEEKQNEEEEPTEEERPLPHDRAEESAREREERSQQIRRLFQAEDDNETDEKDTK